MHRALTTSSKDFQSSSPKNGLWMQVRGFWALMIFKEVWSPPLFRIWLWMQIINRIIYGLSWSNIREFDPRIKLSTESNLIGQMGLIQSTQIPILQNFENKLGAVNFWQFWFDEFDPVEGQSIVIIQIYLTKISANDSVSITRPNGRTGPTQNSTGIDGWLIGNRMSGPGDETYFRNMYLKRGKYYRGCEVVREGSHANHG